MEGTLKIRTYRDEPAVKQRGGHLVNVMKKVPVESNGKSWKFYIGLNAYLVDEATLLTWGTVPEGLLRSLSYGERRLIHYLASKKQHVGCCYITQQNVLTKRFLSLRKLIHKGFVVLERIEDNIIYFRIAGHFSDQKKFIIATCKYVVDHKIFPDLK